MGASMNLKIKKVLEKIEENGFEAYIVGGYVRDYLLGIYSTDVDICTNALPKDILTIFDIKKAPVTYGSVAISNGEYNFDITTYRTECNYKNRRPEEIKYTNNLLEDIKRRDFTINSLCMNKDGKIFDYLNGTEDINNKIIKVIGNPNKKLEEDPLRILRAIRFSVTLDFSLDLSILQFISNNANLIRNLSFTRKKEELDRIFSHKNVEKGLNLLKELNLLDALEINYDNIVAVPDLLGIWAQISFSDKYPFSKNNLNVITKIRKILNNGEINAYTLFSEDLYVVTVASKILQIDNDKIIKIQKNMPIKSKNDLVINGKDIIDILDEEPSNKVKTVYNDIIDKVLNYQLKNNYDEIKDYILKVWK